MKDFNQFCEETKDLINESSNGIDIKKLDMKIQEQFF